MSSQLTGRDIFLGMGFAQDQINRLKCQDSDILKKICPENTNCLKWKTTEWTRIWPKPDKVTDVSCKIPADCHDVPGAPLCQEINGKKVCAYKPDDVESGTCVVSNPEYCKSIQKLPYTCDDKGLCKAIDKDKLGKAMYTEWHPEEKMTCNEFSPCYSPDSKCQNGVCTCSSDVDCPGSFTCQNGVCSNGGRCIFGNHVLKMWCENPGSRCIPNDKGEYPAMCKGSDSTPGVVDVPPFFYNEDNGKCYITKDYCDRFDLEYNKGECQGKDSDCPDKGDKCYKGMCTGPGSDCYASKGKQAAQFFIGNTIFSAFKHGFDCPHETKENYENSFNNTPSVKETKIPPNQNSSQTNNQKNSKPNIDPEQIKNFGQSIFDILNKSPETAEKIADEKLIESKMILQENFAPGINLYLVVWKKEANMKPRMRSAVLASEVKKKYPKIVIKKNGVEYIKLSKKDIGQDTTLKRIFFVLNGDYSLFANLMQNITKNLNKNIEDFLKNKK